MKRLPPETHLAAQVELNRLPIWPDLLENGHVSNTSVTPRNFLGTGSRATLVRVNRLLAIQAQSLMSRVFVGLGLQKLAKRARHVQLSFLWFSKPLHSSGPRTGKLICIWRDIFRIVPIATATVSEKKKSFE